MRRWWFGIHKWIGLVIGIQILAWIVSGLFMTIVPIEQVRSEHNIRKTEQLDLRESATSLTPAIVQALPSGRITRIELGDMLGAAVWRVDVAGKPVAVVDATSNKLLSPLTESVARRVAQADFAGVGRILRSALITEKSPIEYRGVLPVWRFDFDDADETHLYVSPVTGKVLARRNSLWRMYDFLWSLHIMDYQTRDNFNNWLVIISAAIGLVLTITGFGVLVYRLRPGMKGLFRVQWARARD